MICVMRFMLLILAFLSMFNCTNIQKSSDFCVSIDSVVIIDSLKLLERYDFTVLYKNEGKENIKLKSVDTFCGCLTEKDFNHIVSSGELGTLSLSYLPQEIGYIEHYIFLYFEEQEDPVCFKIKRIVKAVE